MFRAIVFAALLVGFCGCALDARAQVNGDLKNGRIICTQQGGCRDNPDFKPVVETARKSKRRKAKAER